MAPPRKIVKRQQEIMIDFLEQNIEMAKGLPMSSPIMHQATKEKWIKLTRKLNSVEGGDKKAVQGWKRYWFTWRHRCSKKAENVHKLKSMSSGDLHRFLPLDDVEVRVLQLHDKRHKVRYTVPSKLEFLKEDTDSEPELTPDGDPQCLENVQIKPRHPTTDNLSRTNTPPPPQWALDLEDRRIAAEERMAEALESIANTMRIQEERRVMLDERIADALTAIAGTLQDINSSSLQKNSLNNLQTQPIQENSMKDVIFL